MPINVAVDEKLVEDARKLGEHDTDEVTVVAALEEYVRRCGQLNILELFGTIDYDPDYDYKALRGKKRGWSFL